MENKLSLKNISIIYNEDVKESLEVASFIQSILEKKSLTSRTISTQNFDEKSTLAITVGGDGTLLNAARFYSRLDTPVFGINLGRLGFLAQANLDEIEDSINKLTNNQYKIEERLMIEAQDENIIALNDIVIKGDSFSRTSKLFLSINGKVVCDYLADGIIISTPTGSTAYTLSAGGPVISPEVDAIVIVPICPHTLTARPLVIPSHHKISVTTCKTCHTLKLSADGQNTINISANNSIVIQKSQFKAKLVILQKEDNEFYSILRQKLQWGVGLGK